MPKEQEKVEYLPGEKPLKAPFMVYADLECLLKKILSCQNNPGNSYTEKKATHKPIGVQYARLMIQKTNATFVGERIVLKSFVKI